MINNISIEDVRKGMNYSPSLCPLCNKTLYLNGCHTEECEFGYFEWMKAKEIMDALETEMTASAVEGLVL